MLGLHCGVALATCSATLSILTTWNVTLKQDDKGTPVPLAPLVSAVTELNKLGFPTPSGVNLTYGDDDLLNEMPAVKGIYFVQFGTNIRDMGNADLNQAVAKHELSHVLWHIKIVELFDDKHPLKVYLRWKNDYHVLDKQISSSTGEAKKALDAHLNKKDAAAEHAYKSALPFNELAADLIGAHGQRDIFKLINPYRDFAQGRTDSARVNEYTYFTLETREQIYDLAKKHGFAQVSFAILSFVKGCMPQTWDGEKNEYSVDKRPAVNEQLVNYLKGFKWKTDFNWH